MSRQRVTVDDAKMIWTLYHQSGDASAKALATAHGYSLATYYNIIRQQGTIPGAYLHPVRNTVWNPLQKGVVSQIIADNPTLTLNEIIDEAVQHGLPRISASTLNRYLKVLLITRKRVHVTLQMRNSPETKTKRQIYCQWFLANQHMEFIFIDEFGFNIGNQRRFGRAPQGQIAPRITPLTRSANISVCIAVSATYGLIYDENNNKAFNRETFAKFMNSLAEAVDFLHIPNPCFILDNCRIHNEDDVIEASQTIGCHYSF
jgi:hypothetical protein